MAGAIQKGRYGAKDLEIGFKGEIDLVTEVDKACEKAVVELLRSRFPSHDIVTEETHLAQSYPFFCCSVALTLDGKPVAGAVYDCIKEELFTAEQGGGAHLNGRRL